MNTEDNMPPEGHAEASIWGPPQASQTVKRPTKKKREWGFLEILISVVALLVVQVGLAGIMTAVIASRLISEGMGIEDTDAITQQILDEVQSGANLVIIMISMYVIWLGTMFYATWFKGLKSFAKDFWVRFNWKRDIPIGIGLAIGLRGAEIGIFSLMEMAGVDLSGSENTSQIVGQEGIWYFVVAIVLASFIGPICEELFFRGMLLQAFLRNFARGEGKDPKSTMGSLMQQKAPGLFNAFTAFRNFLFKHRYALAAVLSGLIFGLMHVQPDDGTGWLAIWLAVIETGIIGIIFGFIVVKTKRLGIVIIAHCMFNLSGVILSSIL